jgi:hypothetical protein
MTNDTASAREARAARSTFGFDGTVPRFVRQRVPRPVIQADLQDRLLARFKRRSAPEP